jgi:hypothetical protein
MTLYEICFVVKSTPVETDELIERLGEYLRNYYLIESLPYKRKIEEVV